MTNHPNRSRQTNDQTADIDAAIAYPVKKLAAELDRCSPELRALVAASLRDLDSSAALNPLRQKQYHAALRLREAAVSWTKEAQRKQAEMAAFVAAGKRIP